MFILKNWICVLFGFAGVLGFTQIAQARQEAPGGHPNFTSEQITRFADEMERLTSDFGLGDLVVFDLDNTVFREVQMLGTDEWFSDQVHQLKKGGLSHEARERIVGPLNAAIKSKTEMKLMEAEIPQLIQQLQRRGVTVIGLTARHPNLENSTLGHLLAFGIDFSITGLAEKGQRLLADRNQRRPLLYKGGVAFTAGATKGLVLRELLKNAAFHPRKMAAIDDRIHHMESYVEALQDLQIEGVLIHYLKSNEEDPYDPDVGEVQTRVFNKLGLILSDEEARAFLQAGLARAHQVPEGWGCSRLLARSWPARARR